MPTVLRCCVALAAFCAGCGGAGSHTQNASTVRSTTAAVPSHPKLNTAALIFSARGARPAKLIACLRASVDPAEMKIFGPRHHVVVLGDLRGRSNRALRQLLTEKLAACDPHWRNLALLSTGSGATQTIYGRSP